MTQQEAIEVFKDFRWLDRHCRAFWRSRSENIYSFIWWGILGCLASALAAGSFRSRFAPKWEERLIGAAGALLLVGLAGSLQAIYQRRKGRTNAPLLISADEDTEIMEQRIHWHTHVTLLGEPQLTGTSPFVDFDLPVMNASVLSITFEPEIEGRIHINGEEQKDKLQFRQMSQQPMQVPRGTYNAFTIRQWLTPEVAKQMQERTETEFNFGRTAVCFSFLHLGQRRTVMKAIGNQVIWKRLPTQTSQALCQR